MIEFEVNGERVKIRHLLLDYTGTLSESGKLIEGIRERLKNLRKRLDTIEVLTSDTFHTAEGELKGLDLTVRVIEGVAKFEKEKRVIDLGAEECAAIGNGNNDTLMLKKARLSIATINSDGAFAGLLKYADIVVCSTIDALDMLIDTRKLIALLRD